MNTTASEIRIPAVDDRTLGQADFITLRLILFYDLETDLPLQLLHDALRRTGHWDFLCKPFRSYHKDIVVPHATESSLPLAVMCEPFKAGDNEQRNGVTCLSASRTPHRAAVLFPPKMVMDWEGEPVEEPFCSDSNALAVPVQMVDCVTFFESGVLAYSLAFAFGEGNPRVDLNAQQLLAVGAMVGSAGQLRRGDVVKVALQPDSERQKVLSLPSLIRERLDGLANGWDIFSESTPDWTVFTFLDEWQNSNDRTGTVPPLALRDALVKLGTNVALREREGTLDPGVLSSIGIEVIGAEWHERVLDYLEKATRREARVDEFSSRLSGLAQNIFDFRRQDLEEVNDSLFSAARIGTDITFVQRGVAIRFIERSRAFEEMRTVLGGPPYWLLVQLVLGHNERLLSKLNADLEVLRRQNGLEGMVRKLLVYGHAKKHRIDDSVERLKRRYSRRLRLIHYIPNILRYPTEQLHYDTLSRARGLEAQHRYLDALDATIERTLESTAREATRDEK